MQLPKILVAIRKRPLSKKQQTKGQLDIVSIPNQQTVIVSQYKQKVDLTKYIEETPFTFDFSFGEHVNNQQIYLSAVQPLIASAFQGAKVTCFAYGQTGSGKTFTMNGSPNNGVLGLYTLGAYDIFARLANPQFSHLSAKVTFFEIYCGKLFDLLNKRQELKIREDNKSNIHIVGIEEVQIYSVEQFNQLLNHGSYQRITSQNSANSQSSRSHAILQVTLKDQKKTYGKISFIDLAGNQRGADHMDMNKQTRIDGAQINKSLLSLKQCIRALDQGKGHTPFRGSKLTMVLKDSFIGFCRTLMIGNISPSSASSENTLNTLRYADRVKQLRRPQTQIQTTKEDLRAKELMLPRHNKNAIKIAINNDDDQQDIHFKRLQAQKNLTNRQDNSKTNLTKFMTNDEKGDFKKNLSPQKQRNQSSMKPMTSKMVTNNNDYKQVNGFNNQTINKIGSTNIKPALNNYTLGKNQTTIIDKKPFSAKNIDLKSKNIINSKNGITTNNSSTFHESTNQESYKQLNLNSQRIYKNSVTKNNLISRQKSFDSKISGIGMGKILNNSGYNSNQQFNFLNHKKITNYQTEWQQIQRLNSKTDPNIIKQTYITLSKSLQQLYKQLKLNHNETLRSQIDTIKQQSELNKKMQDDRACISTREYVDYLRSKINQKIFKLQNLREILVQVRYKLDQVQQVERIYKGNMNDQQLLDNY